MDEIGGRIKNVVFHQVKSSQIIINTTEDFCEAANQSCPSITTLFQKSDVIVNEPSDIEDAPIIPGRLKIHKFTRCPLTATGETQINFYFLSNSKELCFTQKYFTKKRCSHVDHDSDSLAQFRSACVYSMAKHMDADETQD